MRKHHAFEGKELEVLGWMHRDGRQYLVLVLPDGTRSLIPADWTNLHPPKHTQQKAALAFTAQSHDPRLRIDRGESRQQCEDEATALPEHCATWETLDWRT